MTTAVPVVAIDGPSGSGKGTISRAVAGKLGWHLLDSGALYRLTALDAERHGVALDDFTGVAAIADGMRVRFGGLLGTLTFLDDEDVTDKLRTEEVGAAASRVAVIPAVRHALLSRQRAFAQPPGLVADGRDMGTVVFPDAILKVFLTASPDERSLRRHKQLKEKGIDVSLPDLSWDIAQRDTRDANRGVAPLKPASDARIIDSTSLSPEEVIARILTWLEAAGAKPNRA